MFFTKKVVLPDGLVQLNDEVFKRCESLVQVDLPNDIKRINDECFKGCASLEQISFPKDLTFLGHECFYGCSSLKSVDLSTVSILGFMTFARCEKLEEIRLSKDLTALPREVFRGCTSLKEISLPQDLKFIENGAFRGCCSLKKIVIPPKVARISQNAFFDCLDLEEVILPEGLRNIAEDAFNSCINLKHLHIPQSIELIKMSAFEMSEIRYFYKLKGTEGYECSSYKPDNQDVEFCLDFQRFKKCFYDGDLNIVAMIKQFGDSIFKVMDLLTKDKFKLPYRFLLYKTNEEVEKILAEKSFKFIKSEPIIMECSEKKDSSEQLWMYEFMDKIGCFSNEKYRDKNGMETSTYLAQKATSFMAKLLKQGSVKSFFFLADRNMKTVDKQKTFDFVSYEQDGKFVILEHLLELEESMDENVLDKIMNNIDKIKAYRRGFVDGKPITRSWAQAIDLFVAENMYNDITEEDRDIASLFVSQGISESLYNRSVDDRNNAKARGVPEHLLGKHLKEKTIQEEIQDIGRQTELELSQSIQLANKALDKQFTYEWLSKYDPKNFVLGAYCSCCASITSIHYGSTIARKSVLDSRVQNLVVRDSSGEIVAKATFYLNREQGYLVANDFEINQKYKEHETIKGWYNVDETHPEEIQREKIFQTFMRGLKAFIKEYDEQNPDNPIKSATVGGGYNRLKAQTTRHKKVTRQKVPTELSFNDADFDQYCLYLRNGELLAQDTNTTIDLESMSIEDA